MIDRQKINEIPPAGWLSAGIFESSRSVRTSDEKPIIYNHQSHDCVSRRLGSRRNNLFHFDILPMTLRISGNVMLVYALMMSDELWRCSHHLHPPASTFSSSLHESRADVLMHCDLAKSCHLPTLNNGEERFLSDHESFDSR